MKIIQRGNKLFGVSVFCLGLIKCSFVSSVLHICGKYIPPYRSQREVMLYKRVYVLSLYSPGVVGNS